MSDFNRLSAQAQSLLWIKLDGLIEACVQASTTQGLGVSEALDLMLRAVMRELQARQCDRAQAEALVFAVMDRTWRAVIAADRRLV